MKEYSIKQRAGLQALAQIARKVTNVEAWLLIMSNSRAIHDDAEITPEQAAIDPRFGCADPFSVCECGHCRYEHGNSAMDTGCFVCPIVRLKDYTTTACREFAPMKLRKAE